MKNFTKALLCSFFAFFCLYSLKALADGAGVIVAPTNDELAALVTSLGGLKGASALVIAATVVQGLMLLLRTKLGEVAGKWRLLIVYLLTMVGAVLAQRIAGLDLGAALVHSNVLAAAQVFVHQIVVQFFQKAE